MLVNENGGVVVHVRDAHDHGNVAFSARLDARARYLVRRDERKYKMKLGLLFVTFASIYNLVT